MQTFTWLPQALRGDMMQFNLDDSHGNIWHYTGYDQAPSGTLFTLSPGVTLADVKFNGQDVRADARMFDLSAEYRALLCPLPKDRNAYSACEFKGPSGTVIQVNPGDPALVSSAVGPLQPTSVGAVVSYDASNRAVAIDAEHAPYQSPVPVVFADTYNTGHPVRCIQVPDAANTWTCLLR